MAKIDLAGFIRHPTDRKYLEYIIYDLKFLYLKLYIFLDEFLGKTQFISQKSLVSLKTFKKEKKTAVDEYWSDHTVAEIVFKSPFFSKQNLKGRFRWYPKYKELMNLYGDHRGEIVLDYGCGPGNDIVGFGLYSNAKKIIGMDVSLKALKIAQGRVYLHNEINPKRIELIQISDKIAKIPLRSSSIDHIYSEGVLHHTSNMEDILKEFRRVLKSGSHASIMVYNQKSVFYHLWLAYGEMIILKKFPSLKINQAFTKSTDGVNCPISRCFTDEEFISIGKKAGFRCEFVGGYLSKTELKSMKKYLKSAIKDKRLAKNHKSFLKALTYDRKGLPMFEGKYAGIGGVYRFYKD